MFKVNYNPDVLSCLANLSNDEVFTPPKLVNDMLDMLPDELWRDKNATFLDPVSKSGVFLREIAKRLTEGLKEEFPDQQERVNHIFKNQLFGIAITELTSLLSRRSVYCSKYANGTYSVCTEFDTEEGNIVYERIEHTWKNEKCVFCGASKSEYDRDESLETHAYQFIHTENTEELFDMRFDVIIGNPPYQLSDGGNNASATPIYNLFVEQAIKMNPRYLSMIIPARWYCGGRGLASFRELMLNSNNLKVIHDYSNATECFPGIRVGGGVCYFLWDKSYDSDKVEVHTHENNSVSMIATRPKLEYGLDFFIRDSVISSIYQKVLEQPFKSVETLALPQKPYGFRTNFKKFDDSGKIKLYTKKSDRGFEYIRESRVDKNQESIHKWKVVTSRSTSVPEEDNGQVLRMSQTFIVEPGAVVTESYVVIGIFNTENEANNFYKYVKTKFFRVLCLPTIVSPDVSQRVFKLVPVLDFDVEWTDDKLYEKYNLKDEEVKHIESIIREVN